MHEDPLTVIVNDHGFAPQNTHRIATDLPSDFDPEEITDWAKRAQLAEGNSPFLTQRNGFRIQLRQFKKAATTN